MLKSILVPVDGSENSMRALRFAMELGQQNDSSISVVNIDIPYDLSRIVNKMPSKDDEEVKEKVKVPKALDFARAEAEEVGYKNIRFKNLIAVDAAERICEEAENMGADLVVMGNRGHGVLMGLFMGSVSMKISQNLKCPITIVK